MLPHHTTTVYGPFTGPTQMSRCEKKTSVFYNASEDTSTIPPYFFTDQMPFLPPNQQCQSTEGN